MVVTKIHKFQRKKYLEHIKDGIELKEINVPIDYDVIDALTLIQTYQEKKLESPEFLRKKQSFDCNSLSSLSSSGMLESGASSFHDTLSMIEIDKMSIQSQESLNDDCLEPSLPYSLMLLDEFTHHLEVLKDGIERIEKRNEERLKTINSSLYKTA